MKKQSEVYGAEFGAFCMGVGITACCWFAYANRATEPEGLIRFPAAHPFVDKLRTEGVVVESDCKKYIVYRFENELWVNATINNKAYPMKVESVQAACKL